MGRLMVKMTTNRMITINYRMIVPVPKMGHSKMYLLTSKEITRRIIVQVVKMTTWR